MVPGIPEEEHNAEQGLHYLVRIPLVAYLDWSPGEAHGTVVPMTMTVTTTTAMAAMGSGTMGHYTLMMMSNTRTGGTAASTIWVTPITMATIPDKIAVVWVG